MQSAMIVVMGIAGMAFGWFVYSKFIAEKIYQLDSDFVTPAHELNDGVDFHPTNKYVLWGHHFTSVAGAAPIVGPAIAVYWGWVPAVLWVTLGTIFFAGVHDFGAIWASARHKGRSIGALSEDVIGSRTRARAHAHTHARTHAGEHRRAHAQPYRHETMDVSPHAAARARSSWWSSSLFC